MISNPHNFPSYSLQCYNYFYLSKNTTAGIENSIRVLQHLLVLLLLSLFFLATFRLYYYYLFLKPEIRNSFNLEKEIYIISIFII